MRRWVALALACAATTACGEPAGEYGCSECGLTSVAVGDGVAWAAQGRTVWRLEAASGDTLSRTGVMPERRGSDVQAIVLDGSDAWIAWTSAVARLRPGGALLLRRPRRPRGYVSGMITVHGRTWLAAERWVFGLSGDGSVRTRLLMPARAAALAGGDGVVWVAGPAYAVALDARTGRRIRTLATSAAASAVAAWRGRLWVLSDAGLEQLDARTGRRLRRVPMPAGRIAIGDGYLWTLTHGGSLLRRDPETGQPNRTPLRLGYSVGSLATGEGAVWVGGGGQDPGLTRVDPASVRVAWERRLPPT